MEKVDSKFSITQPHPKVSGAYKKIRLKKEVKRNEFISGKYDINYMSRFD